MTPRTARTACQVATALASLVLTACQTTSPNQEQHMSSDDLAARPTLGAIEEEYLQMRQEITDALDAALGRRPWTAPSGQIDRLRAACGEAGRGTEISWAPVTFPGTYDPPDWQRSVDVVREVARGHGFTEERVVRDEPGDLLVRGEDEHGGSYEFGLARNTVLALRTGCHLDQPAAGAPEPSTPPG